MERRIEPEPALGRKVRVHRDVGDQEAVAEHAALGLLAEQLAHAGARAVARDEPVGRERVVAVGGLDACSVTRRPCVLDADHLVVPAQVEQRQLARAFGQVALDVVLLQVDERRAARAAVSGSRSKLIDLLVALKNTLPTFQPDALVAPCGSPQPRRSRISSVRLAKQIAREPVESVRRCRAAPPAPAAARGRSRARGPPARRRRPPPGGAPARARPDRRCAGSRSAGLVVHRGQCAWVATPSSACHISLSRSAVQMRGSA